MYALMVNRNNCKGWVLQDASINQFYYSEIAAFRAYDLCIELFGVGNVKLFKLVENV